MTDAYRDLCIFVSKKKLKPNKKLLELFKLILEQIDFFIVMYNKFEIDQIAKMKRIENRILETYEKLNLKAEEMILAGHLITAHYSVRHATEELD